MREADLLPCRYRERSDVAIQRHLRDAFMVLTWSRVQAARVNEERLKKDIDELRGKVSRLHEELAGNNQTWKMAKMDEAERYNREYLEA